MEWIQVYQMELNHDFFALKIWEMLGWEWQKEQDREWE